MPRGRKKKQQELPVAETSCEGMVNIFGDKVCEFSKGDRVFVTSGPEDAPDNFLGQVVFHKWSNISGWWLEIRRDDSNRTYSVPIKYAQKVVIEDEPLAVGSGQDEE